MYTNTPKLENQIDPLDPSEIYFTYPIIFELEPALRPHQSTREEHRQHTSSAVGSGKSPVRIQIDLHSLTVA